LRDSQSFYNSLYNGNTDYAASPYADAVRPALKDFIHRFNLKKAILLDIGCGKGWFQDLIEHWIGLDISPNAGKYAAGKDFICGRAEAIPLKTGSIDAIWSITFLEHSPNPEKALEEMERILSEAGVLFLAPAWRVPPWRPKGYEVKRYKDLNLWGIIVKAFLPLLNFFWTKGPFRIPMRIVRELELALNRRPTHLHFYSFEPNLNEFLLPDCWESE
jgi:SAM-dependent methyltransferase